MTKMVNFFFFFNAPLFMVAICEESRQLSYVPLWIYDVLLVYWTEVRPPLVILINLFIYLFIFWFWSACWTLLVRILWSSCWFFYREIIALCFCYLKENQYTRFLQFAFILWRLCIQITMWGVGFLSWL